jgi:predicted membrane protein
MVTTWILLTMLPFLVEVSKQSQLRTLREVECQIFLGGSTFDLMDAELSPGTNVLDMFCLFGGSKIIIPSNWKVKIEVTAIFGGYSDKRKLPQNYADSNNKELIIKGVVIFGGGEIKSH